MSHNEKVRVSYNGREVWAEYVRPLAVEEYRRAGIVEYHISINTRFSVVKMDGRLWAARPALGILTISSPLRRMVFAEEVFILELENQKYSFKALRDFCIESAMRDIPQEGDLLDYLTFNDIAWLYSIKSYSITRNGASYSVAE